jgi:hypothetical protein
MQKVRYGPAETLSPIDAINKGQQLSELVSKPTGSCTEGWTRVFTWV